MPGKAESNFFEEQITLLAGRYSAPLFLPHITLSGVPKSFSEPLLISSLKEIVSAARSFSFSTAQYRCGETPYQKIMLELNRPAPYLELCKECDRVYNGSFSKTKYPHLSVFYGNQSCEKLTPVVHQLNKQQIPPRISIESIALVEFQGTPESWKIIENLKLPEF